jgi:hypothetical protein
MQSDEWLLQQGSGAAFADPSQLRSVASVSASESTVAAAASTLQNIASWLRRPSSMAPRAHSRYASFRHECSWVDLGQRRKFTTPLLFGSNQARATMMDICIPADLPLMSNRCDGGSPRIAADTARREMRPKTRVHGRRPMAPPLRHTGQSIPILDGSTVRNA